MNNKELIKKYIPKEKQQEAQEKLEKGIPIQYIIGNVDFYGNIINVDERVLIPRFETETLVEKTIKYANKIFNKPLQILDLGCGSGCISIALKKELNAKIWAIDISKDALELAQKNADINNVEITFIEGNMEKKISQDFDIIISNPPYIAYDGFVEENVKKYEPNIALFAKDNGLYFYKKILEYAFQILNKPGLIAFEIGDNQKESLEEYIKTKFPNIKYSFENDLAGMNRYLFLFNE